MKKAHVGGSVSGLLSIFVRLGLRVLPVLVIMVPGSVWLYGADPVRVSIEAVAAASAMVLVAALMVRCGVWSGDVVLGRPILRRLPAWVLPAVLVAPVIVVTTYGQPPFVPLLISLAVATACVLVLALLPNTFFNRRSK